MSELVTTVIDGEERYITPTDEQTGLPLSFAPTVLLPRPNYGQIDPSLPDQGRVADWEHRFPKHFVRTQKNAFMDEPALSALSGCRLQWVDFQQHHYKNNNWFTGPALPQTPAGLAVTLVMAEAGYVPREAVDYSGLDPKIVRLSNKERKWLWTSGQIRVGSHGDIRKYLSDYVLNAETDHLDEKDLEEFYYTFDHERRITLGKKLALLMVERAVEPIEEPYRQARKHGLLTFVNIGGRRLRHPDNATELVTIRLTSPVRSKLFFADLHERLAVFPRRPRELWETDKRYCPSLA